ncbi:hypothetical protein ABIA39_008793 [Nocardia sp. GAS34]
MAAEGRLPLDSIAGGDNAGGRVADRPARPGVGEIGPDRPEFQGEHMYRTGNGDTVSGERACRAVGQLDDLFAPIGRDCHQTGRAGFCRSGRASQRARSRRCQGPGAGTSRSPRPLRPVSSPRPAPRPGGSRPAWGSPRPTAPCRQPGRESCPCRSPVLPVGNVDCGHYLHLSGEQDHFLDLRTIAVVDPGAGSDFDRSPMVRPRVVPVGRRRGTRGPGRRTGRPGCRGPSIR